ncbi:hypothetical protein AAC387_Pa09g1345 [Persea americana]
MIKRRFYKDENADRNDVLDSSSSSDDESDSTKEDEEEEEEETIVAEKPNSPTLGSGYESEDSSGNEAHFNSKRHARSKKLLERQAQIVALAENLTHQKKKNEGRQRQRERLKKRLRDASKEGKASESMKKPTKKKRKI